jgi:putative restriction endonuclease
LPDRDWQLRLAAFARLEELTRARGGIVTHDDLEAGFTFEGERIKFWSSRRGIWRPKQLADSGAALSITTTPPKPGKKPPYEDQITPGAESFVYRYEGTDPGTYTNIAVRQAMIQRRPLIYFIGLEPGRYAAVWPCYVTADRPDDLAFEIQAGVPHQTIGPLPAELDVSAGERRYATQVVMRRLHQFRFRQLVIAAYRERCTVCRLAHRELLDAAHILPDRDERGHPEVPNGLALCAIHHGAYDAHILGVDPDYLVHIRRDVLDEKDGPMLLHGLQELHGARITLPRAQMLYPNRDYLAERFGRFRAA